jgi:hypothetical protein
MVSAGLLLLGAMAWAGDDPEIERAKLVGKWQLKTEGASEKCPVWVLEDKRFSIHITRLVGVQTVSDFECELGKECKTRDSGKAVTEQMYFNGPRLVELETKGSEIVKRRFAVTPQADTLEVEVIPLVPAGKSETLVFTRAAAK